MAAVNHLLGPIIFRFFSEGRLSGAAPKQSQGHLPQNIQVLRRMVAGHPGRIFPEHHIKTPM
jgi:hypothetical protein